MRDAWLLLLVIVCLYGLGVSNANIYTHISMYIPFHVCL